MRWRRRLLRRQRRSRRGRAGAALREVERELLRLHRVCLGSITPRVHDDLPHVVRWSAAVWN